MGFPTTTTEAVSLITPTVCDTYARDGIVILRQALHPEWLLLLQLGLDRVMGDSGQKKHLFYDGTDQQFIELVRTTEVSPELQRFMYDSPLADMMAVLLNSSDIWLYSDEWFVKGPNGGRTPWHQDLPYWPMEGSKIASAWISLDTLPASECLEYVRGTHHGVRYDGFNPRRVSEDPTLPYFGSEYPPLPNIEADRSAWDIVSWDITPGDIILAHPGVLHGGGPTGPNSSRRAITIRMYGDDIVYAPRPPGKPTVPLTPGLSLQLKYGDPLRSPWYPRLRPVPPWQQAQ